MKKTFSTILHLGISLVTLLILLFVPLISVGPMFGLSITGSNVLSMFFHYGLPDNEFLGIILGTLGMLIFTIVPALLDLPKETKAIGIVRLIMNIFQFLFAVLLTGVIAEEVDSFPGAIVLTCFSMAGLIVAIVLLATFRKRHKASSKPTQA